MTRSSTKELFTPFENPEREFHSSRKLFKTLSLDESSLPEFDLFSYLEEHSKEEVAETMAEPMEEYMCKTRGDHGSGVTRPKIDAKYHFELKGQFLKELRDNTFSGSDHENEHIEKVLEIVNLFHIPNITQDQIMLRAFLSWERFKELLMKCPQHYLTDMTRSTETSNGSAAIQAQLNNLGREIKKINEKAYVAQNSKLIFEPRQATYPFPSRLYDGCYDEEKGSYGLKDLDADSIGTTLRNDALPQKEKDPGSFTLPCYINNVCFQKSLADLGASVSVMPLLTYLNLGLGELAHTKLTVELADRTVKHPKGIAENVLVGIGDEKNIFKSVKPASSLIKRVYILSLRERMDLDLEARMMGETLILNKSFDPLYGDYIELNNLNEILELRRNRVDDLEPTVEEGEVVNEPVMDIVKTRCDFISGLDYYPSNCDFDRRIHIDYAYNLKFSCMMGFEYVHANFLLILPINVMSKKFYNTIMKDKIEFNRRNELGNFINAPVFIGNFYVITNFTVVKDMDPYLDE
ncbi:reverse transcriptase domain-containing protein [Tanacetum coccineum]